MQDKDRFKDIRPYKDQEVAEVINRLLRDNEFVDAITKYQFPRAANIGGWLLRPLVRIGLVRVLSDVESIADFQQLVGSYVGKMLAQTTTRLSVSGIEYLDPDEAYLFISNHRDIAMDPAFVNWSLREQGFDTARIAIGDNLLQKPYVSDLMRLNKSFIVKRSATAPREMLKALTQLSEYIEHSLTQDEQSIWIAQREGRAKDGNDHTEPAVLKMFHVAQRKHKRSFAESMQHLNIVPVAISYEYDPCDAVKANELQSLAEDGHYEKAEFEDMQSIVKGILGFKGHVHVSFGEVLKDDFETPEEAAAAIDTQIHQNYFLHETNRLAAGQTTDISSETEAKFAQRQADLSSAAAKLLIDMYANPVKNKQQAEANHE